MLTLDFERVPPSASIQTYSAMTLPCWGRSRYFWSWGVVSASVEDGCGCATVLLTLVVLET